MWRTPHKLLMSRYLIPLPHPRGYQNGVALPDREGESLATNDIFLHLTFGRLAANDGTTVELTGSYSTDANAIELCVDPAYLGLIENISVGPNLSRFLAWLNKSGFSKFTEAASSLTLDALDDFVTIDATTGNCTILLPSTTGIKGKRYTIKKIDNSINTVEIKSLIGQTIDKLSSYTLQLYADYVGLIAGNNEWLITAAS